MARPISTSYTLEEQREIADHVVAQIAIGRALTRILVEDADMPNVTTFYDWMRQNQELAQQVERAREDGAATILDEIVQIADETQMGVVRTIKPDGTVEEREEDMLGHRKLRVYAREKYAQMIAPRRFGAKLDLTSKGEALPAGQTVINNDNRVQSLIAIAMQRKEEAEELKRIMDD